MKIAVLGCGHWGKNLVRNFKELGVLSVVCDPTPAGRQLAASIAPDATIGESIDDAIDARVDGVVVATPAETHFGIASRALEAGLDVTVEKPMALSIADARTLVRLARERDRILMVGHVLEYHPAIVALRDLVRAGELGKIHYIYSTRLSLGKIRREENILWSFAPHDIAVILRLMGALPFQVLACGGAYIQPNIPDVTVTNMLFDNGVRAHIHVSWLHPFKEQRLVVIGSKKMATFDDVSKKLLLYDQRVELKEGEPVPIKGEGEVVAFDAAEPLRLACQAFHDAVHSRETPLTDGRSGLDVLKVLEAAQRSLTMNGEAVALALEAEREATS
jgi:predicted dehydrogenase